MANEWMHWLTKYKNKKCMHAYALYNMATLFNNHPYISSSGAPVCPKFTATYVGMVFVCVHATECICTHAFLAFVLCQPVHSCSEPSLHELNFFSQIFLWRLVLKSTPREKWQNKSYIKKRRNFQFHLNASPQELEEEMLKIDMEMSVPQKTLKLNFLKTQGTNS